MSRDMEAHPSSLSALPRQANDNTDYHGLKVMSEQFEKYGDGLLVRAPGKINLSLLVAGKRPDGYHNIETIMAKIDWYDEILIENKSETGIELICRGPYKVPEGEDNLVYKAAEKILKFKNQKVKSNKKENAGLKITLTKNMPAGSGLGSGSSDAAATLLGVNKFLKLGLEKKELSNIAEKLGSDIAFFLDGPLAFCTGKGEKVKKLGKCEFRGLLIVPDVSVSTARVYGNYRHNDGKYRLLRGKINEYIEKKRLDLICDLCANMLEESCFEMHRELGVLKNKIESLGLRPVSLSGSGSSMFCIINDKKKEGAESYRDRIEHEFGCKSFIVNNNTW